MVAKSSKPRHSSCPSGPDGLVGQAGLVARGKCGVRFLASPQLTSCEGLSFRTPLGGHLTWLHNQKLPNLAEFRAVPQQQGGEPKASAQDSSASEAERTG